MGNGSELVPRSPASRTNLRIEVAEKQTVQAVHPLGVRSLLGHVPMATQYGHLLGCVVQVLTCHLTWAPELLRVFGVLMVAAALRAGAAVTHATQILGGGKTE